jgi:large subunit ribosomal protein L2
MFLVSPRLGSPGVRYRAHFRLPSRANLPFNPNRLTCGFLNAAGRSRAGTKTIWSKGARYAKRKFSHPLNGPSGSRLLGLVCNVLWQPQTRAALALVKNSVGAWFLTPTPEGLAPLSYFSVVPKHKYLNDLKGAQPTWWWPLTLLDPYSRASMLPTKYGLKPQLVRSPGSTALILTPHLWDRWALVVLPSGQLFISSNQPYVLLGGVAPVGRRGSFSPTAGSMRRKGFAPTVRGVAQNPNDHPHGGRTKTVRYPRTPWGRTTKYPRPARPKLKLGPLDKRRPKLQTLA